MFGADYYQHEAYNNNNNYPNPYPSPVAATALPNNSSTQWEPNYPPQLPMAAAGITNQDHYYANQPPVGYADPNMNYYNQQTYYDPYQQQQQQQYQYMDPYNQQMYQPQPQQMYNNSPVPQNVSPQFNTAIVPQTPNTPTTVTSTAISTGSNNAGITNSNVYSAPNSYPEDHEKSGTSVGKKQN